MKARSLYLHFPFCEARCHYCDFYALALTRTNDEERARHTSTLKKELSLRANFLDHTLDTIFCGGGTPSLTPIEQMESLFAPLITDKLTPTTEWTLEANPSSVSKPHFERLLKLGVNRISMGVQAFDDELLKILGRVHSKTKAIESLETLFESGFTNVSVDLLCGIPGQSLAQLELAMQTLTRFPIKHLSCYLLTLPPHHPMYKDLPNEETQLEHLLFIDKFMTHAGFEHYEISNFARPGFEAKHNLAYWKGLSYLGLGPSAHSYDSETQTRFKNVSSLKKYFEALDKDQAPLEWSETLNQEQLALERWMLSLRLSEGFPDEWLSIAQTQKSKILISKGLLEPHPLQRTRLRLTPRGLALSDQVIKELALA
jgi:oxygen-independent coproporphyrinogen-3 oxidase